MIKLETAHIEEMRGIRKLDLDFSKQNFAISGPNGSDKSGLSSPVLLIPMSLEEFGCDLVLRRYLGIVRNWPVEQHRSSRGIRFTCSAVCGKPAESALLERPLPLPAGHRSDRLRGS